MTQKFKVFMFSIYAFARSPLKVQRGPDLWRIREEGSYTKRCRGGPYLVDEISKALDTRDTIEFWVRYINICVCIYKDLQGPLRNGTHIFTSGRSTLLWIQTWDQVRNVTQFCTMMSSSTTRHRWRCFSVTCIIVSLCPSVEVYAKGPVHTGPKSHVSSHLRSWDPCNLSRWDHGSRDLPLHKLGLES
jgi:hypothetical protein